MHGVQSWQHRDELGPRLALAARHGRAQLRRVHRRLKRLSALSLRALVLVACASILAARAAEARWTVAEALIHGEMVTVEIWSNREVPSELAAGAIDEYTRVRGLTDVADPKSEISHVNDNAAAQAVNIGAELFVFVDLALGIANRTSGAFDPTSLAPGFSISPLSRNNDRAPLDYRSVILDREQSTLHFAVPELRFDSSALAPAYALAAAREWLRMLGVEHARLRTRGIASYIGDRRGESWSHGVSAPGLFQQKIVRLSMTDAAVASVGAMIIYNERNVVFTDDGVRGSQGRPLRSATVFGRNAVIAAGLAELILERGAVLGFEHLLEFPEYEAVVFEWSGEVAHTFGMDMTYSDR